MAKQIILCVDDDESILKCLERFLILRGYDVLKAFDGEEGLKVLESSERKVDLIFIDQRMPGMGGDGFLERVKERFGAIPAVMLSGHADGESLLNARRKQDGCRFLAKPWDNGELLKLVQDILGNSLASSI